LRPAFTILLRLLDEGTGEMDILLFVLTTVGLGILCAIPGIVVGRLLAARGVVREAPVWLLAGGVCILFVLRLSFPQASLGLLVAIVTVFLPLGMYRQDLWTRFREGKLPKENE
jgi:hypothetical protein